MYRPQWENMYSDIVDFKCVNAGFTVLSLQGCPSPIVVKFADTEKEKLQKKMQQMVTLGGMGMNMLGMGFPYFQHSNYNTACQQVKNLLHVLCWYQWDNPYQN